jgi:hypothetical protein
MARPEAEFQQVIKNMERMGWPIRRTSNGTGIIVCPPDQSPVTINIRASGHGRGLDNAMRDLRRTGYETAWADFQDRDRERRVANAIPVTGNDVSVNIPTAPTTPTVVPQERPTMTEPATNGTKTIDRDLIDGRRVEKRVPAQFASPLTGGRLMAAAGVDEVLLDDSRVLYQCVRSNRCADVFDTVMGAVAHLKKHGTPTRAAKDDKRFEVASRAGQLAQQARRERRSLLIGDDTRAIWLNTLADALADAVPMLRELARMPAPEPEVEVTPEELAELRRKAQAFDVIQGALGRTQ